MDLIQKIFGFENEGKNAGFANPNAGNFPAKISWTFLNGVFVPFDSKDELYIKKGFKAIPIVQAIISEIIDKASDAPANIYRIKNEKCAKEYDRLTKSGISANNNIKRASLFVKAFEQIDHEIMDLWDNPNPLTTGKQFREQSMGYLLLTGNAIEYYETVGIGTRANRYINAWNIPSPCVNPVFSEKDENPIPEYQITYMGMNRLESKNIIHVKYFNPVTGHDDLRSAFWGLSPMRSAQNIVTQKRHSDYAQGSLFKNASPAGVLGGGSTNEHNQLSDTQALNINQKFKKNHMGLHKYGDIVVTPANVKWNQIGLNAIDLQILDFNKDIERQIAMLYRYPRQLLEGGNVVANSETGQKQLIQNAVLPLIRRFDDARTQKLRQWFRDPSLVYISDLEYFPELQPDREKQMGWMRSAGIFTQKEMRRAVDYSEEYDAKDVLVPSSWIPLSQVMNEMTNELPVEPTPQQPSDE